MTALSSAIYCENCLLLIVRLVCLTLLGQVR